ncbi:MAG: hypothetical protein WAN35_03675, partial [Terracidiphilus sp.]
PNAGTTGAASGLATASISIIPGSGAQSQYVDPCQPGEQHGQKSCPYTLWNSGNVDLAIGGYTENASYGSSYTSASQVAAEFRSMINSDPNSPVNASIKGASCSTGSTLVLTAKSPGASGNLSFSSSETWDNQSSCYIYNNQGSIDLLNPCFTGPA